MNTKGQQVLKENAIWGNIALLDGNGEEQSVFSIPNSIYRATIKYRGASSYSKFDKKQYRIKFYKNEKDSAKEVSLAGMGANSEWVLNGPYLDKTLIRNKLVYDCLLYTSCFIFQKKRSISLFHPKCVFTADRYGIFHSVKSVFAFKLQLCR